MSWFHLILRPVLALLVGGLIGSERARHGRAAGMRTHILVCLGATLTSMTSLYVADVLNNNGDVFRIPAQVISGIGFLGAGMIILKSNNMITGLTTAAGVWTTGAIGIALGYGFYTGAAVVTVLLLITIILLAKLEKTKTATRNIYIEIDDLSCTNQVLSELQAFAPTNGSVQIIEPKSGCSGNLGLLAPLDAKTDFDLAAWCETDHVVFAIEDSD